MKPSTPALALSATRQCCKFVPNIWQARTDSGRLAIDR